MKKSFLILCILLLAALALAQTAPAVSNVTMNQSGGIVNIAYDLASQVNCSVSIIISPDSGVNYTLYPVTANLSGDIGINITPGNGKHIFWNIHSEPLTYIGSTYRIRVIARRNDEFIAVTGGTFNNGASNVTVSNYNLSKYEVTSLDYQAVMNTNPSLFQNVSNGPVERVSWFNAIEYCNRRSISEGLTPCYSYSTLGTNPSTWPAGWNTDGTNHSNVSCNWTATGYRLPTEAEWDFAARGGNLSNGYDYSGSSTIGDVAWYHNNSGNISHTVGTKTDNEIGMYDMSGNVWEWVWDIFGEYPTAPQINPQGPVTGDMRLCRGGAWNSWEEDIPLYYRNINDAAASASFLGFRISRN